MASLASFGSYLARGPPKPAVFVARHGEREDYVWAASGRNWQAAECAAGEAAARGEQERAGGEQAAAAARAEAEARQASTQLAEARAALEAKARASSRAPMPHAHAHETRYT